MGGDRLRHRVEDLLTHADVRIDGNRPWDIRVRDPRLFARVLADGQLGLGESYMDKWWDCERVDELANRLLGGEIDKQVRPWRDVPGALRAKLVNLQRPSRAFHIGRHHYDIGNDLYRRMLDRRMIYSSAFWRNAHTLDEAQEAKLDLVCRKLGLEPGMRVLDIGCGWGGTARFAVERYGVQVLGITVSREQVQLARRTCAGLDMEIRLQDYREVDGRFDRILSLGMFEHVGYKNYRTFMERARGLLADDGLFLLHTIGGNTPTTHTDAWTDRYIFPGGMIPSPGQVAHALEGFFVLEDWHAFGPDYDRTLMSWHHNFEGAWPELSHHYDERFYRMWRYFLLSCAGSFRARKNQLWQLVLSPQGVKGGYQAPR